MRLLLLVLAAALAAAGFAYQHHERSAKAAAAMAVRPSADARDTDKRLFLAPEQQKQALQAGGFRLLPVSLLKVDRRLRYGDFVWNEDGVPAGPVTIRVDLRTQLLSIFRAGHEIGTAVVLYGADAKETPLGDFPIMWKGKDHRSSIYDAPMPFTLRLTGDGVAIHGSNVRWGAATHGCVGVPTAFASLLYEQAKVGDVVTIVRTNPTA